MKKKFYYAWAISLMCSLSIDAVAQTTLRPPLFGIDNMQTRQHSPEDQDQQPAKTINVTPLRIAKAYAASATQGVEQKMNVLTSYKAYDKNEELKEEGSFKYDKYGRPTIKYIGKNTYEYTYTDKSEGLYAEMIETHKNDGLYKDERRILLEYDSKDRVTKQTTFERNSIDAEWQLSNEIEYDYSHLEKGVITKDISYIKDDDSGDTYRVGYILTWFELQQDYMRDQYRYNGYTETVVDGNSYTISEYSKKQGDGYKYYLSRFTKKGYNKDGQLNCSLEKTYNEDGFVLYGSGSKIETEENQPKTGYTRETRYLYDINTDEWINTLMRNYYTNGYYQHTLNAEGFREIAYEKYNPDKGWYVSNTTRCEAAESNLDGIEIQKCTHTYYAEGQDPGIGVSYIYIRTADNSEIYNMYVYSNDNYVIGYKEDNGTVYVFYDCHGNVLKSMRTKSTINKVNDYNLTAIQRMDELVDGVWKPVTGQKVKIGEGYNRLELEFNDNGYLTVDKEYYNNKLSRSFEYTYTNNGYTLDCFTYDDDGNKHIYSTETNTLSADNVLTHIEYYYNVDGTYSSGSKEEIYPNGLSKVYGLEQDGTFKHRYNYVSDYRHTDDEGYTTRISRDLIGDDEVIELSKTITRYDDTHEFWEKYKKEGNEWVGIEKYENSVVIVPDFELLPTVWPETNGIDNGRNNRWQLQFIADQLPKNNTKNYSWNNETKSWVLYESVEGEYNVDGNTMSYTYKEKYRYNDNSVSDFTKSATIKRNDAHQVTELNVTEVANDAGDIFKLTDFFTYAYNEDGNMTQREYYHDGKLLYRYIYTYEDIDVIVTEVEQIADGTSLKLRISGHNITANTNDTIKLYDTAGRMVAQGEDGKVVAPGNGMYVVAIGGNSVKVVVNGK